MLSPKYRRFFVVNISIWTALIILSFFYAVTSLRDAAVQGARLWALGSFEKDLLVRHWATAHGGVYVPVTQLTMPNQYLSVPEREISTPSGRRLTLVNPAYMTRQLNTMASAQGDTRSHLTSLNPLNPGNAPEPWESDVLRSFETGAKEHVSITVHNDAKYLRFMRPFVIEEGCLKCHASQGYKVGDIRGGISISVNLEPYLAIADRRTVSVVLIHLATWIAGAGGLFAYCRSRSVREFERRISEEQLKMSERRLSLIYNNISDLVVLLTVEAGVYTVVSVNRALYEVCAGFGANITSDMIVGKDMGTLQRLLGLDDAALEQVMSRCAAVIASREPISYEQSFPLAFGSMYGYVTFIPVFDDNGTCTHLLWSCRNITARIRMLQSLLETEENYAQLFNAMIDGFALVELIHGDDGMVTDFRYLDGNPALEKVLGRSRHDLIGRTIREIFPAVQDEWIAFIASGGRYSTPYPFERYVAHLDRYLAGHIYSPKPDQRAVIFRDVTEQRRIEREKRALEEQLLQSQKMEAVGQLAGGIAHDFNNILTSIISNAYVLKKRISEEDASYLFVDEIFAEAGRAANLTKGLLAFSRKQSIHLEPVVIREVVEKMGSMLKRIIGEDIEISLHLSEEDVSVLADAGQIEQVLLNLATNARDAMPEGGTLTVASDIVEVDHAFREAHGFGEARRYAVLKIGDTGVGMDESTKEKIFEPFFTTKDVGKGTGLGLAIAYGIVRQHRGYLEVESILGDGTVFSVYLPAISSGGVRKDGNA